MPTYDYKCIVCDNVTTIRDVLYEHRMTQRLCSECSGTQTYVFPLEAGIVVHESHFDEGLGCDIGGDRERKQVMKALGLEEAGDAVGGARNEEGKGEGIYAPQGIKLSDMQRKTEAAEKVKNEKMVSTIAKDGTETQHRVRDLSTDHRKAVRQGSKSIGKDRK